MDLGEGLKGLERVGALTPKAAQAAAKWFQFVRFLVASGWSVLLPGGGCFR